MLILKHSLSNVAPTTLYGYPEPPCLDATAYGRESSVSAARRRRASSPRASIKGIQSEMGTRTRTAIDCSTENPHRKDATKGVGNRLFSSRGILATCSARLAERLSTTTASANVSCSFSLPEGFFLLLRRAMVLNAPERR